MKKSIITLSLILALSGCTYVSKDEIRQPSPKTTEKPAMDCRMRDFTLEYLQGFSDGGSIDYEITQEYVDELNSIPHCKDFCEEQLGYSKKYDDWFAEDDLRETCKTVGVILPE